MYNEIYPLTIISDRYTGVYSKGIFTAWNLDFFDVPRDIEDCDVTCGAFWSKFEGIVGLGNTPDEAYEDLYYKLLEEKELLQKNS